MTFASAMAFPNDGCTIRLNGDSDSGASRPRLSLLRSKTQKTMKPSKPR
jgi:hypothetical protein